MRHQPASPPGSTWSHLRPRRIPELLDAAFRLYRRHFLAMLAIAAVVSVPVHAIYLTAVEAINSVIGDTSFGIDLLWAYPQEILTYFGQAAIAVAITSVYQGSAVTFRGSYRVVLKRAGPLLGLTALQALFFLGVFLGILVFPLAILAYVYAYVRFQVMVPALMVEDLGPVQAVRRSWRLVQGYWWRTFGLQIILSILFTIILLGPALLFTWLAEIILRENPLIEQVITGLGTAAMFTLFAPVSWGAGALYYFDLRVRKEGLDLETAMAERYSPGEVPPIESAGEAC